MVEKIVNIYPVSGVQVRIGTEHRIVVLHLPYITGLGTAQKQEHQDHAYGLMPEQAVLLRDTLTAALRELGAN